MIAHLLIGLLAVAAPAPALTPEPDYEAFVRASKLMAQQWAHGSARREAENWLKVVPGLAAKARGLAEGEADPARQQALLALASRYEQGAEAVKKLHEDERPAHDARCDPKLEALKKAYDVRPPDRDRRVGAAYPEARACAAAYGVIVEKLEDANKVLRKVHREAFESRLLIEPARP